VCSGRSRSNVRTNISRLTCHTALGYYTEFPHYQMIANPGHSLQSCRIPLNSKSRSYTCQQMPHRTSSTLNSPQIPMINISLFTPHLIPMITATAILTVLLIVQCHHQRSRRSTRKQRTICTRLARLRTVTAFITIIITTTTMIIVTIIITPGRCLRQPIVTPWLRT